MNNKNNKNSSRSQIAYKIGVLKCFAKFIRKHLCRSVFSKVAAEKIHKIHMKTSEPVHRFQKVVGLKNFSKLTRKHCVGISFLIN